MEKIVCLACGGVVGDDIPLEPGEKRCTCDAIPPDSPSSAGSTQASRLQRLICPSCGHPLENASHCDLCGALVAPKRCPWCLAWNLHDAPTCIHCGRAFDSKEEQPLLCPRCNTPLQSAQALDLHFEQCPSCGGMFLTPTMIQRVIQSGDQAERLRMALPKTRRSGPEPVKYIQCPICGRTMNRKMFGRFSGVVVDVCAVHGVWFDATELAGVLQFVQQGGLDKLREREAQRHRQARGEQRASMRAEELAPGVRQAEASERMTPWGYHLPGWGAEFLSTLAELWKNR